jgi:alkyl sulfatase BDS1-like metallo-beta-lactamase superfamily hydrolase
MAALDPAAIISGHGGVFRDDAREMLVVTARALHWLEDEVVRRLNAGQWYEQIVHEVALPPELDGNPYLQPVYGCTAFVVHSVLRRYTGWYDGNPSMLFPSTRGEIAREVVALAGGPAALLERARALGGGGTIAEVQKALHLTDFVIFAAAGRVPEARRLKEELLRARARGETSFVARNILESAAALEADGSAAGASSRG